MALCCGHGLLMPYNDRLFSLLGQLDDGELSDLWKEALRCKPNDQNFDVMPREARITLISREWRAAHGHTLVNLFRDGHALPWKRILIDVADKLKPGWRWTKFNLSDGRDEAEIEEVIYAYLNQAAPEQSLNGKVAEEATDPGAQVTADERSVTRSFDLAAARSQSPSAMATSVALFLASRGVAAFISLPVSGALIVNSLMSTSYRKTIHATVFLLLRLHYNRQMRDEGVSA